MNSTRALGFGPFLFMLLLVKRGLSNKLEIPYNLSDIVKLLFFQVRIHSFLEKTKNYRSKNIVAGTEEGLRKEKEILMKHVNSLVRKRRLKEVQKLLKKEQIKPWNRDTQAKVCCSWLTYQVLLFSFDYFADSETNINQVQFCSWGVY